MIHGVTRALTRDIHGSIWRHHRWLRASMLVRRPNRAGNCIPWGIAVSIDCGMRLMSRRICRRLPLRVTLIGRASRRRPSGHAWGSGAGLRHGKRLLRMNLPELQNAARYEFYTCSAGFKLPAAVKSRGLDESFDICESDSSYKRRFINYCIFYKVSIKTLSTEQLLLKRRTTAGESARSTSALSHVSHQTVTDSQLSWSKQHSGRASPALLSCNSNHLQRVARETAGHEGAREAA